MLGSPPRLAEDGFMARISKVPRHGAALHAEVPKDIARRVDQGRKNPTLIPNQNIVVRVASFTFRFVCAAQYASISHISNRKLVRRVAFPERSSLAISARTGESCVHGTWNAGLNGCLSTFLRS
jgi:hypothetical protein